LGIILAGLIENKVSSRTGIVIEEIIKMGLQR
jgi:hypothetical protein